MATSKISARAEHSFGTRIALGNSYITIDKDGYINLACDYRPANYVIANVNGIRWLAVSSNKTTDNLAAYPTASCFVKAGMQISAESNDFTNSSTTAYFYPLE